MMAVAFVCFAAAVVTLLSGGGVRRSDVATLLLAPPRSRTGRRLQRALVPWTPGRWWRIGFGTVLILTGMRAMSGAALLPAFLSSTTAVRAAGWAFLAVRSRRLRRSAVAAASQLPRQFALELGAGCGLAEAVQRQARRGGGSPVERAVLSAAAARIALGEAVPAALLRAAECAGADRTGVVRMRRAMTIAGAAALSGRAAPGVLRAWADATDAEDQSRDRAAASAAEARFVAFALPVLTLALVGVLGMSSPRVVAAVASPFGAVAVAAGGVVALAGAATVFLMTTP